MSLVFMAIGMLGIASMLILAHKASSSGYLRQQAIQSAYDMIDRMRANRQAAINGSYNVSNLGSGAAPSAPGTDCSVSVCSPTQMASWENWYWLSRSLTTLPRGAGSITTNTVGGNTIATVTVQWDDSPAQSILGAGGQVSNNNPSMAQFSIGTSL